jgi:hypothetical protein
MAMWFWINWDDQQTSPMEYKKAIEQYTNSGCPLGVLLFLLPWATALGIAYLALSIIFK